MNLAVIGSGGREHAICYKLKQSLKIKKLLCIPGNAGTKMLGENVDIDISNFDLIYKIIKEHKIDLVIVGPEQPLVSGIVDFLSKKKDEKEDNVRKGYSYIQILSDRTKKIFIIYNTSIHFSVMFWR